MQPISLEQTMPAQTTLHEQTNPTNGLVRCVVKKSVCLRQRTQRKRFVYRLHKCKRQMPRAIRSIELCR